MIARPRVLCCAVFVWIAAASILSADAPAKYDVIIRGGTIYDGGGEKPFVGDVAIKADRVAKLGDLRHATANVEFAREGLLKGSA